MYLLNVLTLSPLVKTTLSGFIASILSLMTVYYFPNLIYFYLLIMISHGLQIKTYKAKFGKSLGALRVLFFKRDYWSLCGVIE